MYDQWGNLIRGYNDCIKPLSQQWGVYTDSPQFTFTQSPKQVSLVFLNYKTTVANPSFCQYGPCSPSFQAAAANASLIAGTAYVNTVDQYGNPSVAHSVVNLIAICPINYQLYDDYLPGGGLTSLAFADLTTLLPIR